MTSSSNASALSIDVINPSKFSNLSVVEIIQNVMECVIITCTNSPSDFYVQLLVNNDIMTMVINELNKFVQTKQSVVETIEMSKYQCL